MTAQNFIFFLKHAKGPSFESKYKSKAFRLFGQRQGAEEGNPLVLDSARGPAKRETAQLDHKGGVWAIVMTWLT